MIWLWFLLQSFVAASTTVCLIIIAMSTRRTWKIMKELRDMRVQQSQYSQQRQSQWSSQIGNY